MRDEETITVDTYLTRDEETMPADTYLTRDEETMPANTYLKRDEETECLPARTSEQKDLAQILSTSGAMFGTLSQCSPSSHRMLARAVAMRIHGRRRDMCLHGKSNLQKSFITQKIFVN